jgi:Amt family ammonium transporter
MISLGTTSILWFLIGFSLSFGETAGHIIGNPASFPLFLNMDLCSVTGYPILMAEATLKIPALLFAGYQMMFAVISPALITGAFADRVQFPAYLLFISLWLILVYCPFVHWIWNPQGFLQLWGVRDFAGGIVVHISAGFAALASIFAVGTRRYSSEEERLIAQVPHNRTFVALGAGMLWFGWFGFNGGSALAANGQAVFALVNSSISAAMAMVVWICIEWRHLGKPTLVGACIGCVAGLATITPCAGYVRPWAAFLIGAIAGPFCYGCVELRKMLGWDDALDVWGVHGMGGLIGSILLGALGDEQISGGWATRSGTFFGKQIAACIGCAAYSFIISYLLLKAIDLITPVVPTDAQIKEGLDSSLHGEHAYDEDAIKHLVNRTVLDKLGSKELGSSEDERVDGLFGQFDRDGDGSISKPEFRAALQQLGLHVGPDAVDQV